MGGIWEFFDMTEQHFRQIKNKYDISKRTNKNWTDLAECWDAPNAGEKGVIFFLLGAELAGINMIKDVLEKEESVRSTKRGV